MDIFASAKYAAPIDYSAADVTGLQYTAVYIGVAGDLKIDTWEDNTVTFKNLIAGTILPVTVAKVYNVGTTAGMELIGLTW